MNAGAFSIQRLEGSRGGIPELWVLNTAEMAKDWGRWDSKDRARYIWCGRAALGGRPLFTAPMIRAHVWRWLF